MVTATPQSVESPASERKTLHSTRVRRFRPTLALGIHEELGTLIRSVVGESQEVTTAALNDGLEVVLRRHAELERLGLTPTDLLPTARFVASLRVLRDLVAQGWTVRVDDEGIILDAPGFHDASRDPESQKIEVRRSFAFARNAQLSQLSTRRFVASVERQGIARLFAEGRDLADRVAIRGVEAIDPVLQLIEPNARDESTGIALQDIWRYARLYWSIPYQTTPGRNMFYLVRDRAADGWPLIGISALGNPVLGLAQRDHYFGWSLESLTLMVGRLGDREKAALATHLFRTLSAGIEEVYYHDFWHDQIPDDWRSAVARLQSIEAASAHERLQTLSAATDGADGDYVLIRDAESHGASPESLAEWDELARTPLYTRKRAATLADLLTARGVLLEVGFTPDSGNIELALSSEAGSRAIEVALRRIKQRVLASHVMELITCGAVPPYRDVLGGKLVAMLMLSSQVATEFHKRYNGRTSIIASGLAGRPIVRGARLGAITTSSLYAIASSQYNRIRIPFERGVAAYRRIGVTDSFGTIHLGPDTVRELTSLTRLADGRRAVNNLFGEGTSPKMRQVRAGLDALGLDPNTFLRHHSPRLLYAAPLTSNFQELMLGLSENPEYVFSEDNADSHRLVTTYWRQRWLEPRLRRPEILERISRLSFEKIRLGRELDELAPSRSRKNADVPEDHGDPDGEDRDSRRTFVERLYRSSNSYADRLIPEELDWIHVDLGVDGYLLEQVDKARQIIVTGNPGDGKTHLIERLRPHLEQRGAVVITDANASSNQEILEQWMRCAAERRPFVLAINEWPLFVLQRDARLIAFAAVGEALRQVTNARYFTEDQQPSAAADDVRVIDLNLRSLFAPVVVNAVVDRLTHDRFYSGLNAADPMLSNRDALLDPRVRTRLVQLLQLVSARIAHVTMRQLIGFIAFLLSGGQSEADRLRAGQDTASLDYATLAFEGGEGSFFEAVRSVFDPARVTHPDWDERLWMGDTKADDWRHTAPLGPLSLADNERNAAFRAGKRRFFFEHRNGDDLLEMVPRDERRFAGILAREDHATAGLVRELILDINRFFEPDSDEDHRDRLELWQSHRYDVRAPQAFLTLHSLPHQSLRIEPQKVAEWVSDWLPEQLRTRRSFALVASTSVGKDAALVEVDRELYLTLYEAQRGLGRASWSRTATRRITRFIDRLHGAAEQSSIVEDIRIRNVTSDLDERFSVQRTPARYQL